MFMVRSPSGRTLARLMRPMIEIGRADVFGNALDCSWKFPKLVQCGVPEDQIFEFGDFILSPKERLLLCSGEPVPLTPKAFDVLVVLVRRAGHLVSKDDLLREVWPNTFVEEVNLSVNISALRKALDRGRNGNGMIQTVPTHGYRFVTPVMARDAVFAHAFLDDRAAKAADRALGPQPAAPVGALRRLPGARFGRWALLAALAVAIVGTVLFRTLPYDTSVPFNSIAVLPFDSDAPGNRYLADGLTEAAINGLVGLRSLRVAPRTSAFHYKGLRVTPKDAGRELGVSAVVTASVLARDDRLRIQVDLVDVARDAQVWGALYQGEASELLHLQTRILQDLSRELKVPLSDEQTRQLALRVTDNADAYRAYLQGRYDWNQRSEAGLKRAIEHFQRAIEIDPRFAAAYSGLGDSYATLGYLSYLAPGDAFPAARRHAMKALELDASLAEPHASLAFVKLYFDWDWPGAEAEFQRAIALDPNYAATHQWYSIFLLAAGRPADSFREIQLARKLDPLSQSINTDLGFHYYYTGQYDEAVKQLKFVLELNKDFPPARLWLGRTYQELGKFDDALAEFRHVEERVRDWPVSIAARGFVAGVAGRADEAGKILAEMQRLADQKFVTSYGVALVHAGLGENDAAFAWLNKAFDERSNWLVWLRLDPRWNGLRSDTRFPELVTRMRFPRGPAEMETRR
jgi:DNA-binding winged helix-turn-helix (wHTH) protein/TolB-like protein/Flp pilus assembly protein TadD